MSDSAYHMARRAKFKRAGLCYACGKSAPTKTNGRCESCMEKSRVSRREFMARMRPIWKSLGICPCCGLRLRVTGESRCTPCIEQQDEAKANRRARIRLEKRQKNQVAA